MGENSDKVVHILQQLCSENIPVGKDEPWQAENITEEHNEILAIAFELQECWELISIYHVCLL
jgi:hypothetical protein